MSVGEFWAFLRAVFELFSGLGHEQFVPTRWGPDDIREEIEECIVPTLLYWVFAIHDDEIQDFDHTLLSKDMRTTSRKFHMHAYYMMRTIQDNIPRRSLAGLPAREPPFGARTPRRDALSELVREVYRGDLDEPILGCMARIQDTCMGPHHERIAVLLGYEMFEFTDFAQRIPPCEVFRRIWPTFFDGYEDVFESFMGRFMGPMIMYLMDDYLCANYHDIEYHPVYGLYERKGLLSRDIAELVTSDELRKTSDRIFAELDALDEERRVAKH